MENLARKFVERWKIWAIRSALTAENAGNISKRTQRSKDFVKVFTKSGDGQGGAAIEDFRALPSFSRGLLRARPSIAAPPSGPLGPFDAASGEGGACATAASVARGGVRRRPRPPLLAPHRGGLRRVGEALHPVPRQAPPTDSRQRRDQRLPDRLGGRAAGERLDPEPSSGGDPLPLSRGLAPRHRAAHRNRPRPAAPPLASGADAR